MLFVTLCHLRSGVSPLDGARRRAEWTPPEGTKIVAEYWLSTGTPAVIVVSETDNVAGFFESRTYWADIFEMESYPAVTGEQGAALMQRASAAAHAPLIGVGA